MMQKALNAPVNATPRQTVQVQSGKKGIVRAIVAVTGVVDNVNDLILPGAFTASLKKRRPKVVDDHEWGRKAGRVLAVEEWLPGDERLPKRTKDGQLWPAEAGALVATMQYNLRSERGRESFSWVEFYAETNEAEFSIGYRVPEGMAFLRRDKVRVIRMVDLFEFSHVLFGAASQTMALEVKGIEGGTAGTLTRPALGEAEQVGDDEDDDTPPPPIDTRKPWESNSKKAPMEIKSAAELVAHALAPVPMETKGMNTMKGSYEERTRLLQDAARELMNAQGDRECTWVDIVATYDAEAIVCAYYKDDCPANQYLVPYTFDPETGEIELGAPEPVELSLTAEPKRDETYDGDAAEDVYEGDVEDVAVLEPTLAGLVRASMLANVKTKAGATVRDRIIEIANGLQGKSADERAEGEDPVDQPTDEVPPAEAEAAATATDSDANATAAPAPMDDDPALAPADEEGDEEPTPDTAEDGDGETYTSDHLPDGDWGVYRKTQPIEAVRVDGPFTVETREGTVHCEDGWLALDSEGYPYPIAADEFDQVYEPTSDAAPTPGNVEGGIDPDAPAGNGPAPGEEATEAAPDGDEPETVTLNPDEHFATVDSLNEAAEKAGSKLAASPDDTSDEDEDAAAA
jgi:hypothetical protein